MAEEPKWESVDAPPWAQPAQQAEPKWQPTEAPSWAPKPQRSVLQRAVEAPGETLHSVWEAIRPPTKEEGEKYKVKLSEPSSFITAPLRSLGQTGGAALATVGAIPATILSAPASLLASGVSEAARQVARPFGKGDPARSEEMYEYAKPMAEAALSSVGRIPGIAGTGKAPMPDPILSRAKKVPATGREAEAGRYLESQAADPAKLRADLAAPDQEIVPGSKPTTHQLTGQLGQQERVAARGELTDEFLARRAEQNAARQRAFESAEGTGQPADISEHLRTQLRTAQNAGDRDAQVAIQRAQQEVDRLGGNVEPTISGQIMRRELEMSERRTRDAEGTLWDAVDPERNLRANPQPLQELERSIYGPQAMSETALSTVIPAEQEIVAHIQRYPSNMSFQEMRDLRSLISTRLREELYTRGQTPAYARLSRLRQGVEDVVTRAFDEAGNLDSAASERLRAASAATRARVEQFRPTRGITRREGTEGPYKLEEPGAIPGKIVKSGPTGYDKAAQYLRATEGRGLPELQDAVAADYRRKVIAPDGTVNPAAHDRWLRQYQETLRAIDERDGGAFSQRLRNAGTAQEAVEAAQARRDAIGETEFKKLLGLTEDADVTRTIGSMLGQNDSVGRMQALMRRAAGNPAAEEAVRTAVVKHMRNTLTGDVLLGDTPTIRAQNFQRYVRTNEAALRQVLRPEQMDVLKTIARDLLRETRTNQTKAVGGGSDTYQMFQAERQKQKGVLRQIAGAASPLIRKLALHLGASTLGPAGTAAAVAWDVGQAVRGGRKAEQLAAEVAQIQRLIDEAMLDPAKAKVLLGKTMTYKSRTPGAKAAAAYEAGAAEKQRQRASRQAGGGVSAIGGTGGRSPGAGEIARAGKARHGAGQALQDGGAAGDGEADQGPSYDTKLSPGEELAFKGWKEKYAPQDSGADYDLRGAFKAGIKPDPVTKHWPDTYKKPNHPTFSNESQYAKDRPDLAGSWQGETYVPPRRAEGGEVQAPVGSRERYAELMMGTPAKGFEVKSKAAEAPSRQKIVDTLKSYGIPAGEWADSRTNVDSRALGGIVDEDPTAYPAKDNRVTQAVDPSEEGAPDTFADRFGSWKTEKIGRQKVNVPDPIDKRIREEEDQDIGSSIMLPGMRIIGTDPQGISREVRGFDEGGGIEDDDKAANLRKGQAIGQAISGLPIFGAAAMSPAGMMGGVSGALGGGGGGPSIGLPGQPGQLPGVPGQGNRITGLGGSDDPSKYTGVGLPLSGFAEGGEVEDEKLPLPGASRGLRSAGPTVTSTMREEDIPKPVTNKAGETLPTYILKEWGRGLGHLAGTPGRVYREGMREEDVDWGPQMALQMVTAGGTPAGALGSGMRRPPKLPAGEGVATPVIDPKLARTIASTTEKKGGYTVDPMTGTVPTEGLMMGTYRNTDPRNLVLEGRKLTARDLEDFARRNQAALAAENRYVGTWRDPETGRTYVDVSQRFDPGAIRPATKFGERSGQLSGYDIGGEKTFPVGNWQEFIRSPEFHQRLREMEARGAEYLSQHPTREWWTSEPFARVYGEQRLPQSAGYTAATAPNAAPRENLQTASEYMRRTIRGEPAIQPEWRVPEGMMTRQPGSLIGMEASRVPNLQRAERGALTELQRQKVREEALALTGDPNAVVLDRHHARLAEDPARGVFTNAQEGVVSSTPRKGPTDYDLLKAEFVDEAAARGRTPRDFSADVWTGIRETIKNTSELYGQRHRGSAISGESKSYADHFEDLIADKARHLGISLQEMEARLRSGDANLMSYLLATVPAAYGAYQMWQEEQSPGSARPSSGRNQPASGSL